MSRSVRKTPVMGWAACKSEKRDKIIWHRRMRAMIRQRLYQENMDEILIPLDNEVGNVWAMGKDGKGWFDSRQHPKLMRK
ncbi:MAG: hypothetical protein KY445_12135 [Armatimonadetes bacterium]|nr:hypothetical protein [Armatimonadota bacterium]